MLLMNPHLPWTPGWATYYEAQLHAPGLDLYGATQVGLPVLRFVFSDYLGFTHTVNSPSAVTFYRIATAPGGYRFDDQVLPFQTRHVELKTREPDGSLQTQDVTVRTTVQGPVVAERDGAPIAMRVAGLDRPFALEEYWRMATARDFAGFQGALRMLQIPTFNILYADRDGHIEYLYNALIPRHAFGDLKFWSGTVPGDTAKTLWNAYLPFNALPKVIDPPVGFVQNSNDPPWDAAWPQAFDPTPYASSIPAERVDLRMARALRMLSGSPKISFEELEADKWSTRSELADRILPALFDAVEKGGDDSAKEACEVLAHWDRKTDAQSRGALLFLEWTAQPGAVNGYAAEGFKERLNRSEPLSTPAGLADPQAAVQALDAAARNMRSNYGALDTPWGEVMRLKIDEVDLPASGGPGRLGVFNVIDFGPLQGNTRRAIFGATYVALVSFEHPLRAKVLLSYGESSQPGSPHRSDQLPLLSEGILRPVWRSRAEVEANLESKDRF
jgi:acyl-homoserine-lactone acylase